MMIIICFLILSISVLISAMEMAVYSQGGCAITAESTMLCWGENADGLLTATNTKKVLFEPSETFPGVLASKVAIGEGHLCIVGEKNIGVLCKGENVQGQTGINSPISPVLDLSPTSLTGRIKELSAGDKSSCAIIHDDASSDQSPNLFCWGRIIPSMQGLFEPEIMISNRTVGIAVRTHKATLLADGVVRTFHANDHFQLGIGPTTDPILDLNTSEEMVLGLWGAKVGVAAGGRHTCVISLDGRVACVGDNNRGQLGLNHTNPASNFTYIDEPDIVIQVACGLEFTCYVLQEGSVKCFGANEFGQLGLGDQRDRLEPTLVKAFGADKGSKIVLGDFTSFAIMQDGSVRVWGRNDRAQLGLGRKSFFGDNVTIPQFNDALTVVSRNSSPFPDGLELFMSLFFTTIAIGGAYLIKEFWVGSVVRGQSEKFRKQSKEIQKLKKERDAANRNQQEGEQQRGTPAHKKDATKINELKTETMKIAMDCIRGFESLEGNIGLSNSNVEGLHEEQITQNAKIILRRFRVTTLVLVCKVADADLVLKQAEVLKKCAQKLYDALTAQTNGKFDGDRFQELTIEAIVTGNNLLTLPWPIDMNGKKMPAERGRGQALHEVKSIIETSQDWKPQTLPLRGNEPMTAMTMLTLQAQGVLPLFLKTSTPNGQGGSKKVQRWCRSKYRADNLSQRTLRERFEDMCDSSINCFLIYILRPMKPLVHPFYVRFLNHPIFYTILIILVFTIFGVFYTKKADQILSANVNAPSPGGFGITFLPIPPQYELDRPLQNSFVPAIYGVMHVNLFFLGLLPVPLMRGAIRKLVAYNPNIRQWIPIDDAVFLHKFFAYCLLLGLVIGCAFWMYSMGFECVGNEQARACLAFDTSNMNPVQNVFALRVFVWILWFGILPMMYFVRRGPWGFLLRPIRQYHFELVYYAHIVVAYGTLLLALIARLDVFYPVLVSWIAYFLGILFDIFGSTYAFEISTEKSKIHGTGKDKRPTSIRLKLIRGQPIWFAKRFHDFVGISPKFHAGQWIYLYLPYEYTTAHANSKFGPLWYLRSLIPPFAHPFSIANAPQSPLHVVPHGGGNTEKREELTVELHIGIKDNGKLYWDEKATPVQWTFPSNEPRPWTDKLREKVHQVTRHSVEDRNPPSDDDDRRIVKKVYVSGAYGTAFQSCFNPDMAVSVVIGGGTGLTAAESVLSHFVSHRHYEKLPNMVWFVWSCQTLDELLWCWANLHRLIVAMVISERQSGRDPLEWLTESSNQIGWIGLTLYVTRLEKMEDLINFGSKMKNSAHYPASDSTEIRKVKERVTGFMIKQIVAGGIDDDESHIKDLLTNVFNKVEMTGSTKSMALAFCGPSTMASVVGRAQLELKKIHANDPRRSIKVEFSYDGQ